MLDAKKKCQNQKNGGERVRLAPRLCLTGHDPQGRFWVVSVAKDGPGALACCIQGGTSFFCAPSKVDLSNWTTGQGGMKRNEGLGRGAGEWCRNH